MLQHTTKAQYWHVLTEHDINDYDYDYNRRGVWQANRFLRAGALESWGFIVVDAIDANSCNVDNMISMVSAAADDDEGGDGDDDDDYDDII